LVSLSDMMRCSSSVEPSVMLWDWGSTAQQYNTWMHM
jgi:hypothetical protein